MPTNLTEQTITRAVQASFEGSEDARFRQLFVALVEHLHNFARDVRLTRDELFVGADFIRRIGDFSTPARQEVLLLSDLLGLSILVEKMSDDGGPSVTESSVLGPFYRDERPAMANGVDIAGGVTGTPLFVTGRVRDGRGRPLAGAHVDAWQSDGDGRYDVQQAEKLHGAAANRAVLTTDDDGGFSYWSAAPAPYPVASDGPCGEIMRAAHRPLMRPQHIHFRVASQGHRTLITQLVRRDDPHLEADAIFAAQDTLLVDFLHHDAGTAPDGREVAEPYSTLDWTFTLAAE